MLHLDVSTPQGPLLPQDVSGQQDPVQLLDLPTLLHRDLCCTWTCLYHRGLRSILTCLDNKSLCWSGRSIPQGPELHLDVSGQQEPLLLLDVATQQGTELHLDLPRQQEPMLLLDVYTLEGPELYPDVSTLQSPVQHLDVSALQGTELHLDLS